MSYELGDESLELTTTLGDAYREGYSHGYQDALDAIDEIAEAERFETDSIFMDEESYSALYPEGILESDCYE